MISEPARLSQTLWFQVCPGEVSVCTNFNHTIACTTTRSRHQKLQVDEFSEVCAGCLPGIVNHTAADIGIMAFYHGETKVCLHFVGLEKWRSICWLKQIACTEVTRKPQSQPWIPNQKSQKSSKWGSSRSQVIIKVMQRESETLKLTEMAGELVSVYSSWAKAWTGMCVCVLSFCRTSCTTRKEKSATSRISPPHLCLWHDIWRESKDHMHRKFLNIHITRIVVSNLI